jgi:signal transduction histidine kinase
LDEIRKNDFIGMVSHELKTPLTSLNGYAQILELKAKKNHDIKSAEALGKMIIQIKKMSAMINGFLNISRLESGKIHLILQQFDFIELVEEIVSETQMTISSHQIHFDSPIAPVEIKGDRDKIGSVISNLISNAIKYSPKGDQVILNFKKYPNKLQLSIQDDGIGIANNDLNRLFERYYRVESKESQHISGFGIGLYLSSEIVKRHGGTLWVESEPGIGSTFYFTIPLN